MPAADSGSVRPCGSPFVDDEDASGELRNVVLMDEEHDQSVVVQAQEDPQDLVVGSAGWKSGSVHDPKVGLSRRSSGYGSG